MNAEALVGMTLGTCTLQRLIGRGGMGAVFLAQQSRPRRQVAVKVLFPTYTSSPDQLVAFLERFRRETDAAASLEHPNIMPMHEYGEQNGLAYMVMPYISGGTLRDELEQEGALPFPRVMNYLEQLASALDLAHERGIIHRDVKPANILKAADGRLLLTDFGLVKILSEDQSAQVRLTGAGAPMGTPDFMSPEQVLGEQVDGRADLYALGVVLYQMITGVVPFKGETPMQVAAQHLQTPPRSPRLLRVDLPVAAEQVVLRALAKRPADRYACAQDLTAAFRAALTISGVQLDGQPDGMPSADEQATGKLYTRRGLFDPVWQSDASASTASALPDSAVASAPGPLAPFARVPVAQNQDKAALTSALKPASSLALGSRFGRKVGLLRQTDETGSASNTLGSTASPNTPLPETPPAPSHTSPLSRQARLLPSRSLSSAGMPAPVNTPLPEEADNAGASAAESSTVAQPEAAQSFTGSQQTAFPATGFMPAQTIQSPLSSGMTGALPASATGVLPAGMTGVWPTAMTGAFSIPGYSQGASTGNTAGLTGPMKMVQIPVAGQPGRYVTGLLPVIPEAKPDAASSTQRVTFKTAQDFLLSRKKMVALIAVALLVVLSSSIFLLARSHGPGQTAQQNNATTHVASSQQNVNAAATATAIASATANAGVILSDPLSQNIHNWYVSSTGSKLYFFQDGAYHITDNDTMGAPAIMPDVPSSILNGPFGYSLTMEEIKGDNGNINNQFGMIIRFSQHTKGNKLVTQFYSFEVVNTKNANYQEYQFWKYDDSWGSKVSPWTKIWHHTFGKEFHRGDGPANVNTFKIFSSGSHFTFTVNGKQIGTAKETTFASGSLGMLVNLKGAEVAFSNLLLTNN